jgi:hypothetical protein
LIRLVARGLRVESCWKWGPTKYAQRPVILRHVATTSGHVGETSFLEGIGVSQHSGYVGLEEYLPRGHHEGVSVRVETGSVDHELRLLGRACGW